MVTIYPTTEISEAVTEKSRQCFVHKRSLTEYVVKPRYHGKTRRLVRFSVTRNNYLRVSCVNYYKQGEACPANQFGLICHHVCAALRRLEINSRRKAA